MMMNSQRLRAEKLALRDGLGEDLRVLKSGQMAARLALVPGYSEAQFVLFFVNFRSEIATMPEIGRVLAEGRNVALPLTVVRPPSLKIYQIKNLTTDLQAGYQDIPEPNPACCDMVVPSSLDVVIVPGSVFDRRGGRMGYGGGYYDRFLTDHAPKAIRIGVCFELQVEDEISLEPHDALLDFIVTEDCVYDCFRGKR